MAGHPQQLTVHIISTVVHLQLAAAVVAAS